MTARFEIAKTDSAYPEILAELENAPERIYGIGNPDALQPGVAIVGARKASPYGIEVAKLFAARAAQRGQVVISGGARGCDQAAHRAALDNGVATVVVFGSGADVIYPKSGKKLFDEVVATGGAIISENPWGTQPLRPLFPQRNRIIAGLARLLVIAEAGLPSGTFSTADCALNAGRTVAVVPGTIFSPNSRGSNHLLSQGALALNNEEAFDNALDIAFTQYPLTLLEAHDPRDFALEAEELMGDQAILQALAADAYSFDELTAYFDITPSLLMKYLNAYELKGVVKRGRDGRYQLCKTRVQP